MAVCGAFIITAKIGHGLLVCTRTVYGSTISTRSMGRKFEDARIFESLARSRLNFTDSEVKSSPLWNFTPRRSLTSHTCGDTSLGNSAASAGTSLRFWSRSTSISKMCRPTTEAGVSCWFMMSSVVGSTPWAITTFPAGAAGAATGIASRTHRTNPIHRVMKTSSGEDATYVYGGRTL